MKSSIETIWKEGFLNEKSLSVPKINDLYNQKSIHVTDRVKRMFRVNLILIAVMAAVIPLIYYFAGALWQGLAASALLLLTGWYNIRQLQGLPALNQGANSLEYLRSFDRWLKDVLSRSERAARFSYLLYFLIAVSTLWAVWSGQEGLALKVQEKYPDLLFVGNVPLAALIAAGLFFLLLFWFSGKIYQWDLRLMYGRVFDKLEETIAEMEKLREE